MNIISWHRLWAMFIKEFIQMRRDRLTLGMIVAIPLMQLILFGYAINSNPKHLPTAIVTAEHNIFTRTIIDKMQHSNYFAFLNAPQTEEQANHLLSQGKVMFVLNIPPDFANKLIRGERPQVLLTADATDPMAAANSLAAAKVLLPQAFERLFTGKLAYLKTNPQPIDFVTHTKYNPELITQYNIIPGLLGIILTMMMIIITSVAITREFEQGTMENLLSTPLRPLEVMLGKVCPYIFVGYLQTSLIILLAYFLFGVPIAGSIMLLLLCAFPFIMANLSVGLLFSTIAKNQLQAVQMGFFFFLPSILLSGFMFPFYGMPIWAQYVGNILPLTYFNRIARGIMLKGNNFSDIWTDLWPILIFMTVTLLIALTRYRQTLD